MSSLDLNIPYRVKILVHTGEEGEVICPGLQDLFVLRYVLKHGGSTVMDGTKENQAVTIEVSA